jgi:hypothetical protein
MWTSVALTVSLLSVAPAAGGKLAISNARFTYGFFGMERTDTKFLPGDAAYLSYDIENLEMDRNTGKLVYSLVLRFTDSKDRLVYEQKSKPIETLNALHSSVEPAYAQMIIGGDQPPGTYILQLTVTDHVGKAKAEYKKNFEVTKKAFGFTHMEAPAVNLVGANFAMRFSLVGFQRDEKKFPNLSVSLLIRDEQKKSTLIKPITIDVPKDQSKDSQPEDFPDRLPFPVSFALNRAGKFTIELEATDKLAKKTIKFNYKITVLDGKKFESSK